MKIDKNKTYTVTEIANIARVSKASVSRWLSAHNVSPDHTKGKAKYFNATYVKQYLDAHTAPKNRASKTPTVVELLQAQVSQLTKENMRLADRIKKQDEQIRAKDKQIANWTSQSAVVSKLANDSHQMTEKLLESHDNQVETSNEDSSTTVRSSDSSNKSTEKPHRNWLKRILGIK